MYLEVIFFSWGGKFLRNIESLMMLLLSASFAYLRPPSSGGLTTLLCIYLTNTWHNNLGTNCGTTWPSMNNYRVQYTMMFIGIVIYFFHDHICSSIVKMTNMRSNWILIGFKNTIGYFTRPSILCIVTYIFEVFQTMITLC